MIAITTKYLPATNSNGPRILAKSNGNDEIRDEEGVANARLIATAPELLEALKILLIQFGEFKDGDGAAKFHAINIAKEAIKKAKGE